MTRINPAPGRIRERVKVEVKIPGVICGPLMWLGPVENIISGQAPYGEWDATMPLSVYGRSKLLGEEWVRQQCPDHFIVRTAWLYGVSGPKFVTAILARGRQLAPEGELKVVYDQRGTPTSALALAPQFLALAATEAFGTYHATCRGATNWHEFAGLILKTAGIAVRLTPCTTAEFPRPAPRPANSVRENRLLKVSGLDCMPPWQSAYQRFWEVYGGQL